MNFSKKKINNKTSESAFGFQKLKARVTLLPHFHQRVYLVAKLIIIRSTQRKIQCINDIKFRKYRIGHLVFGFITIDLSNEPNFNMPWFDLWCIYRLLQEKSITRSGAI